MLFFSGDYGQLPLHVERYNADGSLFRVLGVCFPKRMLSPPRSFPLWFCEYSGDAVLAPFWISIRGLLGPFSAFETSLGVLDLNNSGTMTRSVEPAPGNIQTPLWGSRHSGRREHAVLSKWSGAPYSSPSPVCFSSSTSILVIYFICLDF